MRRCLLLLMLLLGGCSPAVRKVDLVPLFAAARTDAIVAGTEAPFHQGAEWRFFLHRTLPLRLTLQMESASAGALSPTLNGTPLPEQNLARGKGVADLEVPVQRLRAGWNSLSLVGPAGSRCQAMLVAPLQAALSSKTGEVVRPSVDGSALLLPFGQTVCFPLPPQPASHLSFRVEPWLEEGVAELADGSWTLTVASRQDDPATLSESKSSAPGPQSASLPPFPEAAMLELSLIPSGRHAPLPGQMGVRLVGPMLEMEATATATPASAPPLTVLEDGVRLRDLKLVARPPALFDLAGDPKADLILQRPVSALHLESVWLLGKGRSGRQEQGDEALRNLRTLEYLR